MKSFLSFLLRAKWIFILCGVLITLFSLVQLKNLTKMNNGVEVWFVEDDPHLKSYFNFQKLFGNDEVIVVAFKSEKDPNGIFTPPLLNAMDLAEKEVSKLQLVDRITCISSIITTEAGADDSLIIAPFLDPSFREWEFNNPEKFQELKLKALKEDQIRGNILNDKGDTTLMLVQLKVNGDIDSLRDQIFYQVKDLIEKHFKPLQIKTHYAGIGVLYTAINELSTRDAMVFFTLSDILILFCLWFVLQKGWAVGLAFSVVILTITWTMGLMGYLGKELNMVTVALPSLLMIVGIADSIHILTHYYEVNEKNPDKGREWVLLECFSYVIIPCFYTSLTTAIGFGSLMLARMGVVKELGLFAGAGCLFAYLISIFLILYYLALFPNSSPPPFKEIPFLKPLNFTLNKIHDLISFHKGRTTLAFFLVSGFMVVGIFQIRVDTFSIRFLFESHWARVADTFIEKNLGYYIPLEFTVESKLKGDFPFKDPENLRKIEAFTQIIENHPEIGKAVSPTTLLKSLHMALNGNDPAFKKIADTKNGVSQEMMIYSNEDAALTSYLNYPMADTARISSRIKMISAGEGKKVTDLLLEKGHALFGDSFLVEASGYLPLYSKMIDYIIESQVKSFAFAFVLIGLIIGILFKSPLMIIVGLLPNLFPLIVGLGTMGWLGIPLDIATVMICSVCLGIAVDDTIHMISMFQYQFFKLEKTLEDAVFSTLQSTGAAVISTSFILFVGFLVLCFAGIKSMVYFGFLTGITMVAALFGDLILLPILLLSVKPDVKKII